MLSGLEIVGVFFIVLVFYLFVNFTWRFLYTTRIGNMLGKSLDMKSLGEWAVITGATDGIGKAYAEECARQGINIVLISRSQYKLQNVAAELENQYDVKTKIIDVDFTNDAHIFDKISKEIAGLDVGILINNVGMSYAYPEFLSQVPDAEEFAMKLINCNTVSVVRMSIMVLPRMMEKRKGLIINVSSAAALLPSPLMSMYSSTKAFVHKFSRDLALEYKPFGIAVQCVLPGFVATNMSRIRRATVKVPTPQKFVNEHIKTLGLEVSSAGYWFHTLQMSYYRFLMLICEPYVEHVCRTTLARMQERALLKRAQLAASEKTDETSDLKKRIKAE